MEEGEGEGEEEGGEGEGEGCFWEETELCEEGVWAC